MARRAAVALDNARLYRDTQEAEEAFRRLFAGTADAVLVADAEGRFLDANPAITALVGYTDAALSGDAIIVPWDPGRIVQVMQNLPSNAVTISPAGGEIVTHVEDDGEMVRVSVRGRGIGIPPEALPGLFGRFHRAANARESGIEGIGLGLYISKALVEAHGGTISMESALGEGSTFVFTLPCGGGPAVT